jgi:hypothetical protein
MTEDPNEHYNVKIEKGSHEGEVVAQMLVDLCEHFRRAGSINEMVDEIKTLYHLTGRVNLAQMRVLEKLHRRFC